MARARNIKPGFFKNELLAELPIGTRLIFIGLWCLADREGRLEDRPKKIKLEIMPFDSFDVDHALVELEQHGFIERYTVGNQKIIHVVNFHKHQSPHGTEKDSPLPDKNGEFTVHKRGKNGYILSEEPLPNSGLTVKPPLDNALNPDILNPDILNPDILNPDILNPDILNPDKKEPRKRAVIQKPDTVSQQVWDDWLTIRKSKKAALTQTAWELMLKEVDKAGWTIEAAIDECCLRTWASFKASWVNKPNDLGGGAMNKQEALEARNKAIGDAWLREQGAIV
jgi:hypothetical protein